MTCPHKVTCTHSNGVKQCLDCHKLLVPDTHRMRGLYDGPQFEVEWVMEKKDTPNVNILLIGEFQLTQYSENSILIGRNNGETMEVKLETLRKFWKENH